MPGPDFLQNLFFLAVPNVALFPPLSMNRSTAISHDRAFPCVLLSGNEEGLKEMRKYTFLNKAASIAVCFGILLSNSIYAFDGTRTNIPRDVQLRTDGSLYGQVYTPDQHPVANAQIELSFEGTTIARTTTGQRGDFLITGVRGGVHEIVVGSMASPVRLWKSGTAPDGASDGYVVAASEDIVRGQAYACPEDAYYESYGAPSSGFGLMDVVALAVMGAAATAIVIAIEDHNNDSPPVDASP